MITAFANCQFYLAVEASSPCFPLRREQKAAAFGAEESREQGNSGLCLVSEALTRRATHLFFYYLNFIAKGSSSLISIILSFS